MSKLRVVAVSAGFGLEAYDWGMYPLLLSYFGPEFFGPDVRRSLISGFAVFAAGFVTRPVGGLVLGRCADIRGRKPAMLLCMAGASVAALGMGLTPCAAVFGAAPLVVLGWRAVLGFFYGGEAPLGHSYVYEMTDPGRRGVCGSWLAAAAAVGGFGANLLVLLLVSLVGPDGMRAGCWRVPFVVGAVASFGFAVLRGGLAESGHFRAHRHDVYSWWAARRRLPYTVATMVFGGTVPMLKQLTAGHTVVVAGYVALVLLITSGTLQAVARRGAADRTGGPVPAVARR